MNPSNSQNPQAIGITLLRVSLGLMWIAHALLKLFVFTLAGTAQFLEVAQLVKTTNPDI